MATYTYAQLESLWIQAGGARVLAPTMAAIALAESSGNPSATNPNDNNGKQTSWGLWQISNGTHSKPTANILDPLTNAQYAVKKFKSQGLGAWGTYTSGAYRKFLKSGVAPSTTLPTGSTSTSTPATDASLTGDLGGAIGSGIASGLSSLFQPMINALIWGGEIIIGGGLMLFGAFLLFSQTQAGKELVQAGTNELRSSEQMNAKLRQQEAIRNVRKSASEQPSGESVQSEPARKVRTVKSREEFARLRKSGYSGPVRHDY